MAGLTGGAALHRTAAKAIVTLMELGTARKITGGRRNRLLAYDCFPPQNSRGSFVFPEAAAKDCDQRFTAF